MLTLPPHASLVASSILLLLVRSINAQGAPSGGSGVSTTAGAGSTCSWSSECPSSAPCCSEYGYCSSGVGCLNGCNVSEPFHCARSSSSPRLTCQVFCHDPPPFVRSNRSCFTTATMECTGDYTFADTSRIAMNASAYNGDASMYDLTLDQQDGTNSIISNGQLALTLTESGGGTRLSTTRAVLYGNIQASIQTTGAVGVVTAFITMSGSKDEIDWEWTGNNTDQAQNNYFWEGYLNNYQNGGDAAAPNRNTQFIVYGFDWTPQQLQWTVAGKVVRTLKRSDTYDSASGRYEFPQTPSRIQMSVWPAGTSASAPGTVTWSGGMIDWSQAPFQALIQWISVDCYNENNLNLTYIPGNSTSSNSTSNSTSRLTRREEEEEEEDSGLTQLFERQSNNINSYIWGTNNSAGQIQLAVSNAATIINSPASTGQNMIVKGNNVKGVTATGATGNALSNTRVGNWWAKLATGAKIGIIIGCVAVGLFIIVALCTCCARRKDQAKAKAYKPVGDTTAIPLKTTTTARPQASTRPQDSNHSLASTAKYNNSAYDQSTYAQGYDQQWPTAGNDYHQQFSGAQAYQGGGQGYYPSPAHQQAYGNYYDGSVSARSQSPAYYQPPPPQAQYQQSYPQRGARY